MRKWFKYYLEFKNLKNKKIKKHHKFKEFEMAMGGYKENDFTKTKNSLSKVSCKADLKNMINS